MICAEASAASYTMDRLPLNSGLGRILTGITTTCRWSSALHQPASPSVGLFRVCLCCCHAVAVAVASLGSMAATTETGASGTRAGWEPGCSGLLRAEGLNVVAHGAARIQTKVKMQTFWMIEQHHSQDVPLSRLLKMSFHLVRHAPQISVGVVAERFHGSHDLRLEPRR